MAPVVGGCDGGTHIVILRAGGARKIRSGKSKPDSRFRINPGRQVRTWSAGFGTDRVLWPAVLPGRAPAQVRETAPAGSPAGAVAYAAWKIVRKPPRHRAATGRSRRCRRTR